jgi:DNA-binding NarL/FixJ family response regulator
MRGQWSLLESLEADDGRRVLIARRNIGDTPDPDGLTPFESQVVALAARAHPDKLIACQLGVAEGTVSASLSHALRKLKISGRIELVRQLGSRCQLQLAAKNARAEQRNVASRSVEDEQHAATIPLPDDARVTHLGPNVAVLEFWVASMMLPPGLTDAEQEVALLIFEGATNEQIAHARGASVKTVGNQLGSIFRKLGVCSRFELVLHLRRGG